MKGAVKKPSCLLHGWGLVIAGNREQPERQRPARSVLKERENSKSDSVRAAGIWNNLGTGEVRRASVGTLKCV